MFPHSSLEHCMRLDHTHRSLGTRTLSRSAHNTHPADAPHWWDALADFWVYGLVLACLLAAMVPLMVMDVSRFPLWLAHFLTVLVTTALVVVSSVQAAQSQRPENV